MASVRVNVAVLSVANPSEKSAVAIENIIADRLTEAGHNIASFEAVRDSETAIRSQLVGWIADPDVDVVVVVGDGEHTGAALKPMVDQALPGFADLLRMLAFQEVGASAMLSTAEAARCGTTFVFVVPGNVFAVKAAMEKLILPQLDPNTKPRNLIASMPRLRDAVSHDVTRVDVAKLGEPGPGDVTKVDNKKMESARIESAVPTPIAPEKTETGAGVKPKLPAGTAPVVARLAADDAARPRSRTGKNVIARKDYDPTKPIELDKLEAQLALSKEEEETKAKPATIVPAARASVATRPLDVGNLRAPATPTGNAPAKPLAPPEADETSFAGIGEETKPLDLTKPTAPAASTTRPARAKPAEVGDATKPMDLGRLPKLPPGANQEALDSDETEQIISPPPKAKPAATVVDAPAAPAAVARIQLEKRPANSSTPLPSVRSTPAPAASMSGASTSTAPSKPFSTPVTGTPATKPTSTPVSGTPTAVAKTADASAPTATPTPTPASASTSTSAPTPETASTSASAPAKRVRQPTPPPPLPGSVVVRSAKVEEVETLDIEPDAEGPAPAAASTTTTTTTTADEDPDVASSHLLEAPRPTKRKPTAPPPTLSELINAAPSSSLAELPQGSFVYPTKRASKVPLVIGLLLLSALIGGGAMFLLKKPKDQPKAVKKEDVVQPAVAIDAAEAPVVAVADVDAAVVEPEPVVEIDAAPIEEPPPTEANTKPTTTKPTTTKPTTTKPTTTKPTTTKPTTTKPTVVDNPPPEKPEKPEKAGPVAEPGCEEVACVLEKYARPCCERFKPKGGTFDPGSADSLSKTQIKAGVDKMRPRVLACAEQHKDVKGTVKLSISVDGEGNVSELSVATAPDDGLGECVASAMRKAKFAKTANGGQFSYPFVF